MEGASAKKKSTFLKLAYFGGFKSPPFASHQKGSTSTNTGHDINILLHLPAFLSRHDIRMTILGLQLRQPAAVFPGFCFGRSNGHAASAI
jgi:hypothetical protein